VTDNNPFEAFIETLDMSGLPFRRLDSVSFEATLEVTQEGKSFFNDLLTRTYNCPCHLESIEKSDESDESEGDNG